MVDKQAPTELQKQVTELIKPYKRSKKKPPFSYEELVVIALILPKRPRVTGRNAVEFILKSFRYYSDLACQMLAVVDAHWGGLQEARDGTKKTSDLTQGLRDAFSRVEVPFEQVEGKPPGYQSEHLSSTYTMSPDQGQAFLQHLLVAPPKKKNAEDQQPGSSDPPFFRLPPELRNYIYELVLLYPKSGLAINVPNRWGNPEVKLHSFTRDWNESFEDLPQGDKRYFPGSVAAPWLCWAPEKILSLLAVNKQISQEAMPVFYGGNTFAFGAACDMYKLSELTPEVRWAHIGHLMFNYRPHSQSLGPKAFKAFKKIPHLRELDIWVYKDEWIKEQDGSNKVKGPRSLLKIPGISTLQSVKVSKAVRFHGDCDELQELVVKMVKKKKVVKVKVTRKRKPKTKTTDDQVATSTKLEEVDESSDL